jgi:hypothetical protein
LIETEVLKMQMDKSFIRCLGSIETPHIEDTESSPQAGPANIQNTDNIPGQYGSYNQCIDRIKRQMVDTTDAAQIIGVAKRTMEDWRYRGGGPPYYQYGGSRGKVLYDILELDFFKKSKRRLSTSDPGPVAA